MFFALKQPKKYQAWFLLGVFTLLFSLLNGCGFHLKGTGVDATAQFKSVQLVDTQGVREDVLRALRQQLKASGVKVVQTLVEAELKVTFNPTQYSASQTSISGSGDATSELIKMSQTFNVEQVETEKSVLDATVQVFRNRQIDNTAALAANRELRGLQRQMAADLAIQIIDRINRAYAQTLKLR